MAEQEWFEVRRFPHGITAIGEPHHREDVKSYLIEGDRDVAVLDTGMGVGDFSGLVSTVSDRQPRVLGWRAIGEQRGAPVRRPVLDASQQCRSARQRGQSERERGRAHQRQQQNNRRHSGRTHACSRSDIRNCGHTGNPWR